MSKMFQNLKTDGLEEVGDRLGGAGTVPSGIYDAVIKVAYAGQSQGGAHSITVIADIGNREYRQIFYITNKQGDNFYLDKQDPSKKMPMMDFTTIDDLCLLITGEGLADQEDEEKVVKIYDFDQKKEVPTPVATLPALVGGKVKFAILREIVDKEKKDDSGAYQPTGETREKNSIDKIFHAETGRTVPEYRQEVDPGEFLDVWKAKNDGKDRDKSTKASGAAGASGTGRPPAAGGSAPKKKLFG